MQYKESQAKSIDVFGLGWDYPTMVTLKADNKRRVAIPHIKPGQVFAFEDNGDGSYTLIKVKADRKEPFPAGSLLKYFDKERDDEMSAMAKKMPLPPLPEGY